MELDFEVLKYRDGHVRGYILRKPIVYHSPRYKKTVTVESGYISDGASGPAEDIVSEAWWVHDKLCDEWKFDDGSPCSNFKASMVLHDILKSEGRWFRCKSWFLSTLLYGPIRRFKNRF